MKVSRIPVVMIEIEETIVCLLENLPLPRSRSFVRSPGVRSFRGRPQPLTAAL